MGWSKECWFSPSLARFLLSSGAITISGAVSPTSSASASLTDLTTSDPYTLSALVTDTHLQSPCCSCSPLSPSSTFDNMKSVGVYPASLELYCCFCFCFCFCFVLKLERTSGMNERESGEELGHFKRIYALRVALCVESRNNGRSRYIILKQAISPSRGYKGDSLIKVLANFVR